MNKAPLIDAELHISDFLQFKESIVQPSSAHETA